MVDGRLVLADVPTAATGPLQRTELARVSVVAVPRSAAAVITETPGGRVPRSTAEASGAPGAVLAREIV
ncbi:MAG TPA: hypothetical protein DD490_01140 [Acidobacteria bacterium]|nr:hypothetical protein [Acidobacteriota bacterium]